MTNTTNRPMRRYDRLLTQDQAMRIVKTAPFATICTCDADGHPYGVPITPVWFEDCVCFHTTAGSSRRNDNMRANPCVTLSFVTNSNVVPEEYGCNYACALIEGTAQEVTDPQEKTRLLKALLARWAPNNDPAKDDRYIEKHIGGCVLWRIRPTNVSGKARAGAAS